PEITSQSENNEGTNDWLTDRVSYIYVNRSLASGSSWDIRFTFGEDTPSGKTIPRVGIVMSPQHAKAFAKLVASTVKQFEERLGEINYRAKRDDSLSESPTEDSLEEDN